MSYTINKQYGIQSEAQRWPHKGSYNVVERNITIYLKHAHFFCIYVPVVIVHTLIFLDAVKLSGRGYIYLPFLKLFIWSHGVMEQMNDMYKYLQYIMFLFNCIVKGYFSNYVASSCCLGNHVKLL